MKTAIEILYSDLSNLQGDFENLEKKEKELEKQNATSDETLKRLKAAIDAALVQDKGIMTEWLRVRAMKEEKAAEIAAKQAEIEAVKEIEAQWLSVRGFYGVLLRGGGNTLLHFPFPIRYHEQ